jgi:ribosomal-protein-alanine N-acetyltransferase
MRVRVVENSPMPELGKMIDSLIELSASLPEAPQWSRAIWGASLQSGRRLVIAESEGELAGFVLYSVVAGESEIESIAVRDRWQRQGVGGKLILKALDELRAEGIELLRLEVRASNRRALNFYKAHGFIEVGLRPAYYAEPVEDAVLMRLHLVAGEG